MEHRKGKLIYYMCACFQILEDKEPEFPSVTICNFNILSTDKMKDMEKYKDIVSLEQELKKENCEYMRDKKVISLCDKKLAS